MKWYEEMIKLIEKYEERFNTDQWAGMILKETDESLLKKWHSILKECLNSNSPMDNNQEIEFLKMWKQIIY